MPEPTVSPDAIRRFADGLPIAVDAAGGPVRTALREAADEIEVLRWALHEACDDAWTDGEAAAESYLRRARTTVQNGSDRSTGKRP